MKKQITTAAAAQILGVTAQRVRDLARTGIIAGEKTGRDWQVDLASVEAYRARPETRGRKKRETK